MSRFQYLLLDITILRKENKRTKHFQQPLKVFLEHGCQTSNRHIWKGHYLINYFGIYSILSFFFYIVCIELKKTKKRRRFYSIFNPQTYTTASNTHNILFNSILTIAKMIMLNESFKLIYILCLPFFRFFFCCRSCKRYTNLSK